MKKHLKESGMGTGDRLKHSLQHDMGIYKDNTGGLSRSADSQFSSNISNAKVIMPDDGEEDLMFPENENIEMHLGKSEIGEKIPFDGRYRMRESKEKKDKSLVPDLMDLFDKDFFDEEEERNQFKSWEPNSHCDDKKPKKDDPLYDFERPNDLGLHVDASKDKMKKMNIKDLNETIRSIIFEKIEEDLKEKGLKLVKKKEEIDEVGAMAGGAIAGFTAPLGDTKKGDKKNK